ncbi:tubulin polyglutamylase TTLL5 isoform X1 [Fundulus heteroclitus]|uniref:tubulin polyglutamylase TTLL5 isoform X1 n=1 Tax=Fundulus heteroclitus TaxID=8078 RepID=UPI00165C3C58|nr:tubulin polyglutamylase TTLL5 isoform X1 [Fundulus heteroclitus]XP_036006260.1 tubulin polyglutamylase TTLL5 isoform X1 [Fundulus heteroclitus]XP_036006261.1 tubulin polyglutamylase TTLL5 isoform X1 [Fundulus heteroclitus]XP_036006262.1 tubulin polyglutamylase TTLL5 isoform X1 [Fundulus heteroclitus]XP_036006263.1 tubulin polyglutamylase TTLL5 isoform X1 [Fundulus heteroclitus]XP_036006264.1 tubulin polyglutamylase TTLL5 isoform X1 [Fundulus heteroclitus]XP_036006265.1 tubulin polyglutamyl
MPAVARDKEDSGSSSEEDEQGKHPCITWSGLSKTIPVLLFLPEAIVSKDRSICSVGERYNMAFKIVRTESRLVRRILSNHGFHEVHPNSNDFNLMWTGSHLKPYVLRSLQDFQKVNHFPRSYELTRKDRLYKNIQRMQQTHGFKNFHIIPQTFVLPSENQEFRNCFAKDKGPWIIKPVASSRGRGIYLVSNPSQISMDENILVSRYINNPLLIDEFKFDVRLYVVVTSYDPLLIYIYEEGLARFATVKYDQASTNIKNTFMHLTNYSLNKKSSDYVSCDDPEVEDYGNKWSMSAVLRYLKQEGKDTTLLMRQVEDLIIKAVLSAELQIATACKMFVPHKANCFELYGFDVLIDSNLKPWLLEVNLSPSLSCDAPLDLKIKASMIADMFSLVGLVGQDPLSRQPRSDRFMVDKPAAAPRVQQKPVSSETNGFTDKQRAKNSQEESTLNLTAEEIKVLRRIKEEYERRGGFIRIFPTQDTWELYGGYLESKTSLNSMLANRLFHGSCSVVRTVNGNRQLLVDAVNGLHVVQYERKLLSLEAQKRRQRHLSHQSAARKKKLGKQSKAVPTENRSQEAEDWAQEENEEMKQPLEPVSHKALETEQRKQVATPLERRHNKTGSMHNARLTVNLLSILQQGWDLSKVQARIAFSSYLQRVQQRLLAESRAHAIPAWQDDKDQMELVIRFLRRAASNLQQDMKVVLPNHQLPLRDRRRILSHQLGEFIHCYNKETEYMMTKQESGEEDHCVNQSVFQEYITAANENDLEEVLTFYTQKNKSANVFLGTKFKSSDVPDSGSKPNPKTLSVTKEDSSASESSLSAGKVCSDPDVKPTDTRLSVLLSDQQAKVTACKTQPDVQSSQHCTSFPLTLDAAYVHLQRCPHTPVSIPLHCPPPPPPPQPPSYAQSLAKSHFCHSETLSDPPAYTSAPVITQPPKVIWTATSTASSPASAVPPSQALRKIQSFTTSTSSSRATFATPSATHIYSQKISRPTSAGQEIQRSSSSNLKSNSMGTFRELQSLSAQAQSNQHAFISALQKLADKQVARHNASSSHINLLTQHLTNLNLASRMMGRESHTLHPKVAAAQRPVRAVHAGKDQPASTRPSKNEEGIRDTHMQTVPGVVTGLSSAQRNQPTKGSYQLQFAIQQLQQQRLKAHRVLDQDHRRHQAQLQDQTSAPSAQVSTQSPICPPSSLHVRPSHGQTCVGPGFVPKPPSSARDGQVRKTATKRLIKQMSSGSSASGSVSSGQQVVYEAICGKTGLSAYGGLLQGQEPYHR